MSQFSGKIVIYNDGILPDNWDINDLLNAHRSRPHNPFIANVFFRSGQIESWGRGIERIKEDCRRFGKESPVFTSNITDIITTFQWDKESFEKAKAAADKENGTIEENGRINDENDIVNDTINGTINDIVNNSKNTITKGKNNVLNKKNDTVNNVKNVIINEQNQVNETINLQNGTINQENVILNCQNDNENVIINDIINVILKPKKRIINQQDITKNNLLKIIKKNQNITANEIAKKIGKTWRTTMRYLEILKKENKIEYYGARKTGGYRIIK